MRRPMMTKKLRRCVTVIELLAALVALSAPVVSGQVKGGESGAKAAEAAAEVAQDAAEHAQGAAKDAAEGAAERAREIAEKVAESATESSPESGQFESENGDVINRNGDVSIAAGQNVRGDVVAVNGTAHVRGKVRGNVVSVRGSIHLYDGAEVKGDAVAIGGDLIRDPKAKVGGSKLRLSAEWSKLLTEKAPALPGPIRVVTGAGQGSGDVVQFGAPVHVKPDEQVNGSVVSFGGPVDVEGQVNGDAVVFGGAADVKGTVSGDAVAIGGSLHLYPTSSVGGDAVTVGGSLTRDEGAHVGGTVQNTSFWPAAVRTPRVYGPPSSFASLAAWVGSTLVLLVLTALVVLIAPRQVNTVASAVAEEPARVVAYGLVGLLLILPVLVVLVVFIITWVAIPFYLLALALLALVGGVGVSAALGRQVTQIARWRVASLLGTAVLGCLILQALDIVTLLPGGEAISWLIAAAVLVVGFGAALMTGFGFDRQGDWIRRRVVVATARSTGKGAEAQVIVAPPEEAPRVEFPPPPPPAPSGPEPDIEPLSDEVNAALKEVAEVDAPPASPEPPDQPAPSSPSSG
jgi:cytoskeletal protein CcmA (bactofilin family)